MEGSVLCVIAARYGLEVWYNGVRKLTNGKTADISFMR